MTPTGELIMMTAAAGFEFILTWTIFTVLFCSVINAIIRRR